MDCERIFGLFLDLGRELIRCGGETHRVEDTLYRLAAAYRFTDCNIWVVPSEIQATMTDPAGVTRTQIRHVRGSSVNFYVLDKLNTLSRWACAELPDSEGFAARLAEIRAIAPLRPWLLYLGGVLGGWGFALFFGCDLLDSLVAALASLLIFFMVRRLSPREGNPLILNFVVSFVTELFILLVCRFGFGDHMETITIGVVMLLVSGLGAFNGLRGLFHLVPGPGLEDCLVCLRRLPELGRLSAGLSSLPLRLCRNPAGLLPLRALRTDHGPDQQEPRHHFYHHLYSASDPRLLPVLHHVRAGNSKLRPVL